MKIFKCDGHRFSDDKKCVNETTYEDEKGNPKDWLTIDGSIYNNLPNSHLIYSSKLLHFCSCNCLYAYLLKDKKLNSVL